MANIVGTLGHCEIIDLCDRRRELRKKRSEPEGSEKYREVNNNIKRCKKKSKENWIRGHCGEIEENLRKNNSKRAYQLVTLSRGLGDVYKRLFHELVGPLTVVHSQIFFNLPTMSSYPVFF